MERVELFIELGEPFGPWREVRVEVRVGGHKADGGTITVHEKGYPGGPMQAAVDQIARALRLGLEEGLSIP